MSQERIRMRELHKPNNTEASYLLANSTSTHPNEYRVLPKHPYSCMVAFLGGNRPRRKVGVLALLPLLQWRFLSLLFTGRCNWGLLLDVFIVGCCCVTLLRRLKCNIMIGIGEKFDT